MYNYNVQLYEHIRMQCLYMYAIDNRYTYFEYSHVYNIIQLMATVYISTCIILYCGTTLHVHVGTSYISHTVCIHDFLGCVFQATFRYIVCT